MNTEEAKGLVIFAGIWGVMAVVACAYMERRLRRLGRVVREIEEDAAKYVN